MNKTTKTSAVSADREYLVQQERIEDQIVMLQDLLRNHKAAQANDPRNWGRVGDLQHVAARLEELMSFFQA